MSKQTILVIDDSPTTLSIITQFLESYDFEVLVSTDGADGLKVAHTIHPDLILLDILMPDIDGYEVCRRLKAEPHTQKIPIIFITSMTDMEAKVKGFAVGAVDYLTKPLQAEEVLARIHTHLKIQELTKNLQEANVALTQRARRLEIINQVARQATSILELDTLLPVVVESIQQAFGYYFVGVWLLNEPRTALLLQAHTSNRGPLSIPPDFTLSIDDPRSLLAVACRTGEPYLANDITQSAHYRPWQVIPLTHAELALPLRNGPEILGALDLQSAVPGTFEAEDTPVLHTLADQIAIAIHNARLYAREKNLRHAETEKAHQLTELNANKDKFFSIVAHDLRGPFQPLLNWAFILSQKGAVTEPQRVQEIGQNLYRAAKDFARLLENLLEWARLQQGRIRCARTILNLHKIIADNINLLAEMAANKDLHLITDINPTLHGMADADMVSAILRNLLSNACKFTPRGGRIMVSARRHEPPPEPASDLSAPTFIEIAITDSGVGIAPADLQKLFRIDVHHTTLGIDGEQGAGLGLTLCQDMVERNGGQIWIESTVGQGTTVTFTLPAAPFQTADDKP